MESFEHFEELGNCRFLFLEQLFEPKKNTLRVQLAEGIVSNISQPVEIAGQSLGNGFPVELRPDSARYELLWNSYVLYQVQNEIYGVKDASAEGIVTRLAAVYRKSSLLDYALRSGLVSHDYSGKMLHFEIVCADHVVAVISEESPRCRKMGSKPCPQLKFLKHTFRQRKP